MSSSLKTSLSRCHEISDSDSDETIDPTEHQVLASDTEPDSPKEEKSGLPVRLKHSQSLHSISDSESDDDTIIPPTPGVSSHRTKLQIGKMENKELAAGRLFGKAKHSGTTPSEKLKKSTSKTLQKKVSLPDISDDSEEAEEPALSKLSSPVKGGSLGRKLSKDPSVIGLWAGAKRVRSPDEDLLPCKDGKLCIRKNPSHFREFSHPASQVPQDEWMAHKKRRLNSPGKLAFDEKATTSRASEVTHNFFLTKVQGIPDSYNQKNALDIKDILSPVMGNLEKSAQFSYMFDIPWLVNQYPPEFRQKPLTIVHGFQRKEKAALEAEGKPYQHLKFCRGKLEILYGTHHTKMMLLKYETGMRVVITTANLIGKDWAQKTQGLWMSPMFPKMDQASATQGDSSTHFKQDLLQYLSVYSDPQMAEWVAAVKEHDMSAARVYIIASVPGRHKEKHRCSFGHLKLRKVLSEEGPHSNSMKKWPLLAQFSSVGSLGSSAEAWLTGEFQASLAAGKGATDPQRPVLKLMYPSKENVRTSLEGYPAGASLPYSINTAKKQTWLHTFWHHWYSEVRGRSAACPHIKTYLRASPDWSSLAWFLVTSANLSKAAWGSLEKGGSQLMIRSYELGVLFLPKHFGFEYFETLRTDIADTESAKVFHVPYDLPPTAYDSKIDRPWVWDIPYVNKPDRHGNKWCPS